ncbi:hypothetical protein [Rathayibacter tritici]|uniref:hypothetical protein n=1 Tax=Rathayibacter tritici TaxID=33888 RepID=UPI000CE7D91A|nr:hypothetical protein [Rathayibacter tritici]PPI47039.1 hypothetical protein C5D18_04645 [Rathayibacter tritici]
MTTLTAWICDTCGDNIADPEKGLVVWRVDDELRRSEFRIVHKGACDDDHSSSIQTTGISELLGDIGQARLLSWLSYGPIKNYGNRLRINDLDSYVDLFRRLQTPWYEEARPHLGSRQVEETWGDANEFAPYDSHSLRRIAEKANDPEAD